MNITLMAIGDNALAIQEIYSSLSNLFGRICTIKYSRIEDIYPADKVDLFVCGLTQVDKAAAVIPREKLLVAEPRFTSEFFLEIVKIPKGKTVGVFHSNAFRVSMIIQGLKNIGFTNLHFLPIAEPQPLTILGEKLRQCEYIIGTQPFLDDRLQEGSPYRTYLENNPRIIRGCRVSSAESITYLIKWLGNFFPRHVRNELDTIAYESILSQLSTTGTPLGEIEIGKRLYDKLAEYGQLSL